MKQILNFFREHDGIEIMLVYIPVTITALVIAFYAIDGILSRIFGV